MMGGTELRRNIINILPLRWMAASIRGGESGEQGGPGQRGGLPLAGRTVLVVEDEFFVGIELAQTLEAAGAEILGPAWSLAEAERLAGEGQFDMAVLDVNLGGDYALDFAIALRNKGIRVVFATAHADDTSLFRGEAAEIPRLSKPTSARALLRALLPLS